jgi:hypothetical protein
VRPDLLAGSAPRSAFILGQGLWEQKACVGLSRIFLCIAVFAPGSEPSITLAG